MFRSRSVTSLSPLRFLLLLMSTAVLCGCLEEIEDHQLDYQFRPRGEAEPLCVYPFYPFSSCNTGPFTMDFGDRVLWVFSETYLPSYNDNLPELPVSIGAWSADAPVSCNGELEYIRDGVGNPVPLIPLTEAEEFHNNTSPDTHIFLISCGGVVVDGTGYIFYDKYKSLSSSTDVIGSGVCRIEGDGTATRLTPGIFPGEPTLFRLTSGKYDFGTGAFLDDDGYVYLYWLGYSNYYVSYRLARVPAEEIENPNAYEFYERGAWSSSMEEASPVISGYTEISVAYNDFLGKYVALYGQMSRGATYAAMKTSDHPWGSWEHSDLLFKLDEQGILGAVDLHQHPEFSINNGQTMYITYTVYSLSNTNGLNIVRFHLSAN